jgi:dTMP kinase
MARFIVIDGLDGCGKATQTQRLKERFTADGYNVVKLSFPNYDSDSSVAVKMYLNGEISKDATELNPYMCGSFYAVDRLITYHQKYKEYFEQDDNTIILADRYISSNIIHQGGKIDDLEEKHKYIKWCYEYECGLCGLPKEDLALLLVIEPRISQKLLSLRYSGNEEKKDIHESNTTYLEKCFNRLIDTVHFVNNSGISNWKFFDCTDSSKENVQPIEVITDKLYNIIQTYIERSKFNGA